MAKFNCSNMPRCTIYTNTYVEKKVEENNICKIDYASRILNHDSEKDELFETKIPRIFRILT